jgi:16S rRNA G1207 methylase RsmC|tara:strand:- start:3640 stop:3975 length:336 start_codon:yes stop_codon:yes gene_type:complete
MGNYINWTEEEFKAYLCIYAADSNFEYHIEEKKLIESKFSSETIDKIKEETDDLNDYQRSHIIVEYVKSKDYTQAQLEKLLADMKEVYLSDGNFDKYEQSIYNMLKKIMKI